MYKFGEISPELSNFKSLEFCTLVGSFCKNQIMFQLESTEALSPMALKGDAKFKEKLTCGFKYDVRNLVNFHPTTQKSKNFTPMGYLCPKYEVWAKKIQSSYLSWHWTMMQNLRNPDLVVSKMAWGIGWTFVIREPKSLKVVRWWALFFPKHILFQLETFREIIIMTLKGVAKFKQNWLVGWKMT